MCCGVGRDERLGDAQGLVPLECFLLSFLGVLLERCRQVLQNGESAGCGRLPQGGQSALVGGGSGEAFVFGFLGCGGGLLSEPMARLGATVVGADAAPRNIPVAQVHAEAMGLNIDYRHTTAEDLAASGEQFDVVLNMEVIEHVADPAAYLAACHALLKPGGLMVTSTINRNPKSWAVAIVGAEHIMRWLPKGTHDWAKFITPVELGKLIEGAGLRLEDKKGFVFNPLTWHWSISDRDLSVNYVTACIRPV